MIGRVLSRAMSTFKVSSKLDPSRRLPDSQIVIIGKNHLIKELSFDGPLAEKLAGVGADLFQTAISKLSKGGSMPLYLNLARIISVSDEYSRDNSPSNANSIFSSLRFSCPPKNVTTLNIILYSEYEDLIASVTAVAKSFPLFSKKSSENDPFDIELEISVKESEGSQCPSDKDIEFLQLLSDNIRNCARLVDTPCNFLNTTTFADEALSFVDGLGFDIKKYILKGEELLENGFGGVYHVGKAASNPPMFIALSYCPENATETIALVGKGIVFDTGGIQLKSTGSILTMKHDMAGAASALYAFGTLVKSGFKQNLHCLLCLAENSISPLATRPDDIITLLSGKTVEVTNTDAEGRLILADGVFYAKSTLKANYIIDIATLTGAQKQATGNFHAAIMSNSEAAELECIKAGRKSGDLVHPLPFCPDIHFSDIKSKVADMPNAVLSLTNGPPSAVAGLFIGAHIDFGKGLDWLHIDMASTSLHSGRATGYGPALLSSLLSKYTDIEIAKF